MSSSNTKISNLTLKSSNRSQLWAFLLANALFIVLAFYVPFFDEIIQDYSRLLKLRFFLPVFSPIILFILVGLLSSNQKSMIVFWKLKNNLPGCKAFSFYARKDLRVDMKRLKEIYIKLPTKPKDQNALWYKIYRKHSENPIVLKSHKDFLLARDMASIALLLILLIGIPYLIIGSSVTKWLYMLALVFQYMVMVILARNFGKRFVVNVLSLESAG